MRVFISIFIPKEICEQCITIQKTLSTFGKITFVKQEHMHLTLKFFRDLSVKKVNILRERLRRITFSPFEIVLDGLEVFPDENFIRVLWIGLKNGEILELQEKIEQSLEEVFGRDKKFHAHLTLGRIKVLHNKSGFKEKLKMKINGSFLVKEFYLMKSELGSEGPSYAILETYSLQ